MPSRGGLPPELGLGGVGQQAQAQVPGLLQMAQAAMDGGGAGGGGQFDRGQFGGGPVQFDPMAGATAGPAPKYIPGTTGGGYNAIFDPRAPSSTGGWFTMADYLKDNPEVTKNTPTTSGNALSTNNWRLLGNDPDQFMINGGIVNRRQIGRDLAPKSVMGTEGTGFPGYSYLGGGIWSYPFGSQGARQGYIGTDPGNWSTTSTPTY